jgi:hypothetical protein
LPFASVIPIPGEGLEGASPTNDNGNSKVYPGRREVYVAQPKREGRRIKEKVLRRK